MSLDQSLQKHIDYFAQELLGMQSGRASKGLVENIKAEANYGTMPIGQLANITIPDNQTIRIEPRDK